MRQALAYRLRHPFKRLFLFCTPVHPSSYCLLASRFLEVYPSPDRRIPPGVQTMMQELAKIGTPTVIIKTDTRDLGRHRAGLS